MKRGEVFFNLIRSMNNALPANSDEGFDLNVETLWNALESDEQENACSLIWSTHHFPGGESRQRIAPLRQISVNALGQLRLKERAQAFVPRREAMGGKVIQEGIERQHPYRMATMETKLKYCSSTPGWPVSTCSSLVQPTFGAPYRH